MAQKKKNQNGRLIAVRSNDLLCANSYVERDEISICEQMIKNDTVYYYDWHDTKNRKKHLSTYWKEWIDKRPRSPVYEE